MTPEKCEEAAAILNMSWGGTVNIDGGQRYCMYADDGSDTIWFNSDANASRLPVDRFGSVCASKFICNFVQNCCYL